MKTKLIFKIVVCLFLSSKVLYSQDMWDLNRCIDYALENNLDFKRQKLAEQRTYNDLRQSYANVLPSINGFGRHGYNYGRTIDRFTNEFATERVMFQDYYASTSFTLFSGFQNINNIRRNIALNTAFRYDTEKLQNDIILAISAAYMQILYNHDIVETRLEQLDVINQQVEKTKILLEGGTVAKSALLEIEAQAAEEKMLLIQADNNLNLSYLELIHLLDLDPAHDFEIIRPEIEIDKSLVFYSPEKVYERSLHTEPSIMASKERINIAEKELAIVRGMRSPSLVIMGNLGTGYSGAAQKLVATEPTGKYHEIGFVHETEQPVYTEIMQPVYERIPYSDQIKDNFNRMFMVSLNIPIFNGWETRTRISNAIIELESARHNHEIYRNELNKIIQQAHADAVAALKKYEAAAKSLEVSRESFKYAGQRFNMGLISPIEYNESKARTSMAEAISIQAKYDYIYKVKILEFYLGKGFEL